MKTIIIVCLLMTGMIFITHINTSKARIVSLNSDSRKKMPAVIIGEAPQYDALTLFYC